MRISDGRRVSDRVRAVPVAVVVAAGVGFGGTALYTAAFGYRLDAPGHFAAGYGLTLALVVLALLRWRGSIEGIALAAMAVTVLVGLVTEVTSFRSLLPDPIDVGNQSLGAVVAAAVAVSIGPGLRRVVPSALVAAAGLVLLGFVLRFGPLGAFTWFDR